MSEQPRRGEHTRAVRTPVPPQVLQRPVGLPVYRSATFAFDTSQGYADVLGGTAPGYSYSRVDNPTADAFAAAVADLEGYGVDGPVTAQPFASGMAAISTTLLALLSAGDHVVASAELYGGTYSVLAHVLPRFGVRVTVVDAGDDAAVRAAIGPQTKVVYAETLANPTMAVADLPALAAAAHDADAVLLVDSTFASPVVCRPLEHGADIVVHSATKYFGGHSDVTGGVAVGAPDILAPVRALRIDLGGSLSPDDAFLLHRGIATLPLRVHRSNETALQIATALAAHPQVERVHHPGLPEHPDHTLAATLFDDGCFGAIISIDVRGGADAAMAFCDRLRLADVAASLGGVHTLVGHVASTTHRQLDEAALAAAGIAPGTVRISVGLEDAADLLADLDQALTSR